MNYREDYNDNAVMVSEDIVSNYTANSRADSIEAITADELLHRLQPRIQSLFK